MMANWTALFNCLRLVGSSHPMRRLADSFPPEGINFHIGDMHELVGVASLMVFGLSP